MLLYYRISPSNSRTKKYQQKKKQNKKKTKKKTKKQQQQFTQRIHKALPLGQCMAASPG